MLSTKKINVVVIRVPLMRDSSTTCNVMCAPFVQSHSRCDEYRNNNSSTMVVTI